MSKSLGNSPDPLDLIAKYGADGLRFGLLRIAPQGQDIRFDEHQIVEGRNFCNKLWNACRFRQMHGNPDPQADPRAHALPLFSADMLAKLDATIKRVDAAYVGYRFSEIAQALYDFVWGDFCDRFIEAAKADLSGTNDSRREAVLAAMDYALSRILRLMHPFTPFVSEELWLTLGFGTESIQQAPWPETGGFAPVPEAEAAHASVAAARAARAAYSIPSNQRVPWILTEAPAWVAPEASALASLLHASELTLSDASPGGLAATIPTAMGTFHLPLTGLVDAAAESARLDGEIKKVESEIAKVRAKLSSRAFVENAPTEVVTEHRQREASWNERAEALRAARQALG